jgi:hypothetical protein
MQHNARAAESARLRWIATGRYGTNIQCPCGGTVAIEKVAASAEFQWEAFCLRCKDCDPNGYSTLAAAAAETPGFWSVPVETHDE